MNRAQAWALPGSVSSKEFLPRKTRIVQAMWMYGAGGQQKHPWPWRGAHVSSSCLVLEAGLALFGVKKPLGFLEIVINRPEERDSKLTTNKGGYTLKCLFRRT